jgi:sec-independent protein translocase protein TatA
MGVSASHLFLVIFAALILFGAGRLPQIMNDLARGIRAFKKGMAEEETPPSLSQPKDDPTLKS